MFFLDRITIFHPRLCSSLKTICFDLNSKTQSYPFNSSGDCLLEEWEVSAQLWETPCLCRQFPPTCALLVHNDARSVTCCNIRYLNEKTKVNILIAANWKVKQLLPVQSVPESEMYRIGWLNALLEAKIMKQFSSLNLDVIFPPNMEHLSSKYTNNNRIPCLRFQSNQPKKYQCSLWWLLTIYWGGLPWRMLEVVVSWVGL